MKSTRSYLFALALLAGCAVVPPPPSAPASAAATVPVTGPGQYEAWYAKARQDGEQVYEVDAAQSLITVAVRRGGALARLGHDHVVASRTVAGLVAPRAGRADFHFRLDEMSVDEASLRADAGLDTTPSVEAIAGTRANMLNRVLQADRFPLVSMSARRIAGKPSLLRLDVTLHGVTRSYDVPVRVDQAGTRLIASGDMKLLQTEFGITPMSVMGGAMTVQDEMELKFRIVALAGTRR